ncbi:MAG: glutamine amidotransferase [Kiritimatiellae bacterium]|nr:glutamine amidotransferase [Kiritimatiellia bacterium]
MNHDRHRSSKMSKHVGVVFGLPMRTWLAVLGLCCGLAATASRGDPSRDPPADIRVTDHGTKEFEPSWPPLYRHVAEREISITSGKNSFLLKFVTVNYNDNDGKRLRSSASVGIDCRTGNKGQGWYGSDTFHLFVNDQDLNEHNGAWKNIRILGQGQSALVEGNFEHAKAAARIRFTCRPGQEEMDVWVAFQPYEPDQAFKVSLSCYPAFFTAAQKRRGDRWVTTPARSVEEIREPGLDMDARQWKSSERTEKLDPSKEWWLFYYDKFFNSAAGNGSGVCGLVIAPDNLEAASLRVTDYGIGTELKLGPEKRYLRFALWQRNERDYEAPLKAFPSIAADAQQRLAANETFLAPTLVSFDEKNELRKLDELKAEATRIVTLRGQFKAVAQAVTQAKGAAMEDAFDAEEKASLLLQDYRRAFWKLRRASPHPLRILALAGAHFTEWKFDEAAASSSAPIMIDRSFFSDSYRGERLTTFPATAEDFMQYDAVAFINVSTPPLREEGQRLLKQFVADGGGLIVCGGFYSYGGGFFTGSVLEEMLPVTIKGPRDVKKLPLAMDVIPGDAVPGLPVLPPGNAGVVMWLHDVTAKPGAKVPLRAGAGDPSKPFLVTGVYGEGRVAAFAATVYGVPPKGKSEFWNCSEWPGFLTGVIRWVGHLAGPGTDAATFPNK